MAEKPKEQVRIVPPVRRSGLTVVIEIAKPPPPLKVIPGKKGSS